MHVSDMVDLQRHDPIGADEVGLRVGAGRNEGPAGEIAAFGHDDLRDGKYVGHDADDDGGGTAAAS